MFQDDGPGQFALTATIPLASAPAALVAGDFGNGMLDLAVADDLDNDVSVLLGNGNGTFQSTPATYAVGSDPVAIVAASLRATVTSTWRPPTKTPTTSRSCWATATARSSRSFRFAAGSFPGALVAADFNGDNVPTWPSPIWIERHLRAPWPRGRHLSRPGNKPSWEMIPWAPSRPISITMVIPISSRRITIPMIFLCLWATATGPFKRR